MQLRARVQIFNPDGTTAHDGPWGPWMLGTTNLGRILQAIFNADAIGADVQRTLVDRTGTNRTNQFRDTNGTSEVQFFDPSDDATQTGCRVGWGDGAGTPARGDSEISGFQQITNVSMQSTDETNGTLTVTGSTVSASSTTLTRVGLYVVGTTSISSVTPIAFLVDHSTVSSVAVTAGQTVAITYQVSY